MRPLADEDLKPRLDIDNPFKDIADIRKTVAERTFPSIRRKSLENEIKDTMDYSGRHTSLTKYWSKERKKYYSRKKKDKLLNFLDSLAISKGQA